MRSIEVKSCIYLLSVNHFPYIWKMAQWGDKPLMISGHVKKGHFPNIWEMIDAKKVNAGLHL